MYIYAYALVLLNAYKTHWASASCNMVKTIKPTATAARKCLQGAAIGVSVPNTTGGGNDLRDVSLNQANFVMCMQSSFLDQRRQAEGRCR